MSTEELGVLEETGVVRRSASEEGVDRLVALGRTLSDPIRVRMLSMMADGRSCCDFSGSGVPAEEGEEGICVCEFEEHFGMGQSKVSYHVKKLKTAGLVREERRGKWAFYSLEREAAGALLGEAADRLLSGPEERGGAMAAAEATGGAASPRIRPAVLDALVVGAGQAGLAAGYHLKRAGLSFEILEARGGAGGSWPGYYDSLKLFSPARYSGLPGMPFPGSPDRYPARDEVVGYLRDYAEAFGLPVLAGKRVLRAEREAGAEFRLLTEDGREHRAQTLIAATGSFARPHRPRFPGQEAFRGKILHAAEYRNPGPFRGKRVVVVGAGDTAVQIAHELARVAETTLATRSPIRFMPQVVLGRDLHFWLSVSGLDRLPLGRLFDVSEPGGVVDDGTYSAAVRSGRPDRRPVFSRFNESGVVWDDGCEEAVDAVLLATGYGPNLGYLRPLGALRADGRPDQRGGASRAVPGLYFVGLPFQTSFASATLRGVGSDAELVVARVCRQVTRSATEPTAHPASVTPPRRVRDVGPSFGAERCCGVLLP